jgi:hypothetical protein
MLASTMAKVAQSNARAEMIERTGRYASLCAPVAWEIAKHVHPLTSEGEMVRVTSEIAVGLAREIRRLSEELEER